MSDAAIAQGQRAFANSLAVASARALTARMRSKDKNAFTLLLEDVEVPVLCGRITRSIDTLADGWTSDIEWNPGKNKALDQLVAPYTYPKAQVYLGSTKVNTGRLYTVTNKTASNGRTKSLEGASYTADLVDSTIPMDPWKGQFEKTSLPDIARAFCDGVGIGVSVEISGSSYYEPFETVPYEATTKYGDFLTKLAFQRGLLVTNDEEGRLLLTVANTNGMPIGTIKEGRPPVTDWSAKFDGRKRWNSYTVCGAAGSGFPIKDTAIDSSVPESRTMAVAVADLTEGNVKNCAQWKRNQELAKALALSLPVSTWYGPDGKLWTPNTLLRVESETLGVPDGFTFLIREVEHVLEGSGATATLSIVPPLVYKAQEKEPTSGGLWQ